VRLEPAVCAIEVAGALGQEFAQESREEAKIAGHLTSPWQSITAAMLCAIPAKATILHPAIALFWRSASMRTYSPALSGKTPIRYTFRLVDRPPTALSIIRHVIPSPGEEGYQGKASSPADRLGGMGR
jgi:hypothetical protein